MITIDKMEKVRFMHVHEFIDYGTSLGYDLRVYVDHCSNWSKK